MSAPGKFLACSRRTPAVLLALILCSVMHGSFCAAENISFRADSMSGTTSGKESLAVLSGNAYIATESMEIRADTIELSGKDFRYVQASGNVSGSSSADKTSFTCTTLSYDRKTNIAVLQDSVHLTDSANDATADAELMEYNQKKKTVIMQIAVSIRQKENTCTGAYALYHQDTKLLFLSGNPQVKQKGDTFRGQEITLNLETQEVAIDGRVRGSVTRREDE